MQMKTALEEWLRCYTEARVHQGRWCFARTPKQTFIDTVPFAQAKLGAA